jgi:hypothetical protein
MTSARHLRLLAATSGCDSPHCPAVYMAEDGENVLVQGFTFEGLGEPEGESVVRIPIEVFSKAAVQLPK